MNILRLQSGIDNTRKSKMFWGSRNFWVFGLHFLPHSQVLLQVACKSYLSPIKTKGYLKFANFDITSENRRSVLALVQPLPLCSP